MFHNFYILTRPKCSVCTFFSLLIGYIFWANLIGPLYDIEYKLLFFENRTINIAASLFLILFIAMALGTSIHLIAIKALKIKSRLKDIILLLMSLSVVSIAVIAIQLLLYLLSENINEIFFYFRLIFWVGLFIQIIFLIFGLKRLFKLRCSKVLALIICSCVLFSIICGIFFSIFFNYYFNVFEIAENVNFSKIQFEKNKQLFENEIIKNPQSAKYHYLLGETYLNYSDPMLTMNQKIEFWNHAEIEYLEALEIRPDLLKAQIGLGCVYLNKKDYTKALYFLQKAAITCPSNDFLNIKIGEAYLKQNKHLEAKSYLRKGYHNKNIDIYDKEHSMNKTINVVLKNKSEIKIRIKIRFKISTPEFFVNQIGNFEALENLILSFLNASLPSIMGHDPIPENVKKLNKYEKILTNDLNIILQNNTGVEIKKLTIEIEGSESGRAS